MQRAVSISKQATALSVLQKRQVRQSCHLLPPGPNTVYGVDMVRVLACTQRTYRVTVPISLLWGSGKANVVHNSPEGEIRVTHTKLRDGFAHFLQELKSQFEAIPSKFTYKLETHSSILLKSIGEAEAKVLGNQASSQRLQPFLTAYSHHTSHLRVQWLSSRPRNVYFVKIKAASPLRAPQCLVKSLPSLSRSFSSTECINTEDNMAPTKLSPIAAIDAAMSECVKAIGETVKGRKVTELVCDFLCDGRQKWVLVNTVGYSFASHIKAKSEVVAPKLAINLKFILMPLMAQRKSFQFAFKHNQIPLSQTVTLEANPEPAPSISLQKTISRKQQREKERKIQPQMSFLHSAVSRFDEICANVQKLKRSERLDLVQKYGESMWKGVANSLVSAVTDIASNSTGPVESFGEEQIHMIWRGIMRILQGDYNFYYVGALHRIHKSLCIPSRDYDSFLSVLLPTLAATSLSPTDSDIIVSRFVELRRAICSGNSKLS